MAVTWITPVDISPETAGSWQDADLSSYLPAGATGAMFHVVAGTSDYDFGCRKNGSTDDRYEDGAKASTHFWASCGVDANRVCEIRIENVAIVVYLVGYFTSDAVFFTNATDKSITGTASWSDIDISSDTGTDTAVGAIFEIYSTSGAAYYNMGLRKNGSTDAMTDQMYRHAWAIIGVDGSEILEGYIGNTAVDFYLQGYIKTNATFNTNATNLSISTTGAYTDLTALPSGATGGLIEVQCGTTYRKYALRKNGSSEDLYSYLRYHGWAFVECDSNRIIEGEINNTSMDFFLTGYTTASTTYTQGVGGASITPDGALSKAMTFGQSAGGAEITPTGAIAKLTSKSAGGATITPAGGVSKQSYKACGGAVITPAGNMSESFLTSINAGGATITPVGALTKMISKGVGGAVITPAGHIIKLIGKSVGGAIIAPAGALSKGMFKAVGGAVITAVGALSSVFTAGGEEPPAETLRLKISRWLHALKDPDYK